MAISERSANALLGAFIVGAAVIAIASYFIIAGNDYDRSAKRVLMVFDGSVKGLNVGAPVSLRGVNIGEVTDIRVRFTDASELALLMEVEAIVDETRVSIDAGNNQASLTRSLVDAGLHAQLNTQSLLTGLLYVQLDFFPEAPKHPPQRHAGVLQIPTIASPLEQLVEEIDRLNIPKLTSDLQNIAAAMATLTEGEAFQQLPQVLTDTLATVQKTAQTTQQTVLALEPALLQALNSATASSAAFDRSITLLQAELSESLAQVTRALVSVESTSIALRDVFNPDAPVLHSLNETLREVARASRSLSALSEAIEEQPQSLLLGRPDEAP